MEAEAGMTNEYRCETDGRRQLLLEQAPGPGRLNAIDFVVVKDGDGVPTSLRQRVLLLRFLFEDRLDTLTSDAVVIRGGVRTIDPRVRWAFHLPAVALPGGVGVDPTVDPELTASERTWLAGLELDIDEPDHWLEVMLEAYGDFSRYELRLRGGAGDVLPPLGFDRRSSQVDFDFKVECPSDFDCRDDQRCATTPVQAPAIDYLARDYASFRRLMFERLALTQPDDPSDAPATTRTAIIEALAFAADRASYYLEAASTETYPSTARTRPSVRRHARLRDYAMHEGCNARAFAMLRVAAGTSLLRGPNEPPLLDVGAVMLTRVPDHGVVVRDHAKADALAHGPIVFEAMHPVRTLVDAHAEIEIHTWGDTDCCLPKGATAATLRDPEGRLALAPGDFLIFEQIRDPRTHQLADADPAARYVVRLTDVSAPYGDPLVEHGGGPLQVVDVHWHAEDALPAALWLSADDEVLAVARANLVLVDHGRTMRTPVDRPLRLQPFGNQGRLRTPVSEPALTYREPYDPDASATRVTRQDPRLAMPEIVLDGEGERWQPQSELLASSASSRDFVVEMENDRTAWLRFGDDRQGRRPLDTSTFAAVFRVGSGPDGNVGAHALAHVVVDEGLVDPFAAAAVVEVRNPLPAVGGERPESIEQVRLYAPHAFRRQERAVTVEDWTEVARRHPGVQQAVATIEWTGSWHTVFVSVDRIGGREVDDAFVGEMSLFLERYRLAGYDIHVAAPHWVPLDIALTVCVAPTHYAEHVQKQLYQEFSRLDLPDGRRGHFHPDELTFGDDIYLSPIVARATAVPGVRWVDVSLPVGPGDNDNRFRRRGRPQGTEIDDGKIAIGRLEIARCDNDPNAPDHGQIRFFMEGGA